MSEDIVVPVVFFGAIAGIVWLVSHYNFKKRLTLHETVRHAVDKGQDLTSALITDPVRADLRRGVLFLAVGVAFGFLGVMVGMEEGEAVKPMIGVASFPVFIGLAYLGLWAASRRGQQG